MGLTNTIATTPGFIGPAVVGVITNNNVSTVCYDVLLVNPFSPTLFLIVAKYVYQSV